MATRASGIPTWVKIAIPSVSVCHAENRRVSFVVKPYEVPVGTWGPPRIPADVGQPTANRLYAGDLRLVKYENHVLDDAGERRGYDLLLDLAHLQD
jgi:hypothetical protein